eukprot:129004_1
MKSSISYATPSPARRSIRPMWQPEAGPDTCETCNGRGKQRCRFCGGTQFLSAMGGDTDELFYEGMGHNCPVCNDGKEVCHECSGTGYVFTWSRDRLEDSLQL